MGAADIILDLVSTGVTLRENNLKVVDGGDILHVRAALYILLFGILVMCPYGPVAIDLSCAAQHSALINVMPRDSA